MRCAFPVSSKARLGFLVVAVLRFEAGLGQAQEPPKQEQPKYTAEEYKAFQEATTETDPAKKIALIVQFLKDRPQSAHGNDFLRDCSRPHLDGWNHLLPLVAE